MGKTSFTLVILQLFAATASEAQNIDMRCDPEGYCTIMREITNDAGVKTTLPYTFKYTPPKAGKPTIVHIPGGPGGTSTNDNYDSLNIPKDFGLIQVDPQFTGKNQMSAVEAKKFIKQINSVAYADDVVAAVDAVKPNKYIIWGMSYGTVPATMIASRNLKVPPSAVVLDSVLAKPVPYQEYAKPFIEKWQQIKETLGPEEMKKFNAYMDGLSRLGITAKEKGLFIHIILHFPHPEALNLLSIYKQPTRENMIWTKDIINFWKDHYWGESFKLINLTVACRETNPGYFEYESFVYDSDFHMSSDDVCKKETGIASRGTYNSSLYQSKVPLVYLQGSEDSVTPPAQSLYHFRTQNTSDKVYASIPGAAHGVNAAPVVNPCREQFWNSLADEPKRAATTLQSCVKRSQGPVGEGGLIGTLGGLGDGSASPTNK